MDIATKLSEMALQLDDQYRACEIGSAERFKTRIIRNIIDNISDTLDLENLQDKMPNAIYREFRGRLNSEFDQYTKDTAKEIALTVSTLLATACGDNDNNNQ